MGMLSQVMLIDTRGPTASRTATSMCAPGPAPMSGGTRTPTTGRTPLCQSLGKENSTDPPPCYRTFYEQTPFMFPRIIKVEAVHSLHHPDMRIVAGMSGMPAEPLLLPKVRNQILVDLIN